MAAMPDWQSWYEDKDLSNDWLGEKLLPWFSVLEPRKADAAKVLEIGSWEGRSAIGFLEILPNATITCVDWFNGSPNHWDDPAMRGTLSQMETRFDRNLAAYGARVRKIKARSVAAMDSLALRGEKFDVIYIDGSHRRDDVLADSVMAWRLLALGGTLIWDDLGWKPEWEASERPDDGIAMFCAMFGSCFTEIHRDWQLIVNKHSEWPDR